MNMQETKMYDFLKDLRENHRIKSIKISFEDEALTGEMAQIVSSVAFKAGVPVTMKIGGCEARRDIHDAKVLGVDKIVAPMIETPYAMKKFVESINKDYTADERTGLTLGANIETITGYTNLEDMLALPEAAAIHSIVLGRVDFSGSLGRDRAFVNSPEMMNYARTMAGTVAAHGKKLCIGGGVAPASLDFFRQISPDVLEAFETRNIVFDAGYSLSDPKIEEALTKAMGFELAWMQRKSDFHGHLAGAEAERIKMISQRYNDAVARLGRGGR